MCGSCVWSWWQRPAWTGFTSSVKQTLWRTFVFWKDPWVWVSLFKGKAVKLQLIIFHVSRPSRGPDWRLCQADSGPRPLCLTPLVFRFINIIKRGFTHRWARSQFNSIQANQIHMYKENICSHSWWQRGDPEQAKYKRFFIISILTFETMPWKTSDLWRHTSQQHFQIRTTLKQNHLLLWHIK